MRVGGEIRPSKEGASLGVRIPYYLRRRLPAGEAKIEISINQLPQLFNSLDPSPFHQRDLDQDAEDYIVESAEEISSKHSLALVIHLPTDQVPNVDGPGLSEAVHNYFAYRQSQERRRLHRLFHDGRIALAIGFGFLFFCLLLRQFVFSFENAASSMLGEGLLIIGWVAMWHPLEIFLYEWVPIRRRCRILSRLSKIRVVIQAKTSEQVAGRATSNA